jgi:hypothetical protein
LDGPFAAPSSSSGARHEIWISLPNLTSAQASLPSLLLFPLQYPPPEETKALDARIAVIRQQQEAIETKLADLKRIVGKPQICDDIRDLELVHASLDDDIADVRLIRGPWCPSRIPPETLCEIFHSYVRFLHTSVWTISQVCRAWRRIAFGCPTLWNTLRITSRAIICSNAYRSRGPIGWDYHVTELQAQRAIRRTREAPLQIQLRINGGSQQTSSTLRVLRVVAGQNLARWRSLVWFDSAIDASLASGLRQVFLPTQEMTSLQHLSFPCKLCDSLPPALIAAMPNLSSLELKLEEEELPTMLMNHPWLGRLKFLTFEFCGHGQPQLGRLGPMVGQCEGLEELSLQRQTFSLLSGESLDSARWPPFPRGLRTILLYTHANFWPCVSGVNITSLTLGMDNDPLETLSVAPRSISLPSLTKLECFSYQTTFTAGYLLDAPKAQSMYIHHWTSCSNVNVVRDLSPDKPWGIYPIKVVLQAHDPNRTLLRDLLLRLSKTNTLSLGFSSMSVAPLRVDPLLALIPDLESHSDIVACPNLHQVEFEFRHELPNSEVSRIDGITQAIRGTRASIGLPRPSVNVRWKGCYFGV